MTTTQKRWLRGSVATGILLATVITVVVVMISGALMTSNYQAGSLTSMANTTMWNAASTVFSGYSLTQLIIPVALLAIAIILVLLYSMKRECEYAGLGEL